MSTGIHILNYKTNDQECKKCGAPNHFSAVFSGEKNGKELKGTRADSRSPMIASVTAGEMVSITISLHRGPRRLAQIESFPDSGADIDAIPI